MQDHAPARSASGGRLAGLFTRAEVLAAVESLTGPGRHAAEQVAIMFSGDPESECVTFEMLALLALTGPDCATRVVDFLATVPDPLRSRYPAIAEHWAGIVRARQQARADRAGS